MIQLFNGDVNIGERNQVDGGAIFQFVLVSVAGEDDRTASARIIDDFIHLVIPQHYEASQIQVDPLEHGLNMDWHRVDDEKVHICIIQK